MQVSLSLSYQKVKIFSIKRKIVKHCFKLLKKNESISIKCETVKHYCF